MSLDLDDLAHIIRVYKILLAYSQGGAKLAFPYPGLPTYIRAALRNRRRGLARMMAEGRIELCPAPDSHRRAWSYVGRGRYCCEYCVQLDEHQLGLWKQVEKVS